MTRRAKLLALIAWRHRDQGLDGLADWLGGRWGLVVAARDSESRWPWASSAPIREEWMAPNGSTGADPTKLVLHARIVETWDEIEVAWVRRGPATVIS